MGEIFLGMWKSDCGALTHLFQGGVRQLGEQVDNLT